MTPQEELFWQEFQKLGKFSLRNFVIMSAILEAQVFALALNFKKSKNAKFKPPKNNEFGYCRKIIQENNLLNNNQRLRLEAFRKARKFIIHDSFKEGASREKLDKVIKDGCAFGKDLVLRLHLKLNEYNRNLR